MTDDTEQHRRAFAAPTGVRPDMEFGDHDGPET